MTRRPISSGVWWWRWTKTIKGFGLNEGGVPNWTVSYYPLGPILRFHWYMRLWPIRITLQVLKGRKLDLKIELARSRG